MMEPHSAEMLRGTIDLFGPLSECVQGKKRNHFCVKIQEFY